MLVGRANTVWLRRRQTNPSRQPRGVLRTYAVRGTPRGYQNLFRGSPDQIGDFRFFHPYFLCCIILKVVVAYLCRLVRPCWSGEAHDVLSRATGWFPRFLEGCASPGESLRGWGGRARALRNSKLETLDFGLLNFWNLEEFPLFSNILVSERL